MSSLFEWSEYKYVWERPSYKWTKRSAGYDEIGFNVIKNGFGELHKPIMYLFDVLLQTGVLPDSLKVAKVASLFETG